jgi:hypothetical protein
MKLSVSVPSLRLNSEQLRAEQFPFEVTNAIYSLHRDLYNLKFLLIHKWAASRPNYNFVSHCPQRDKFVFGIGRSAAAGTLLKDEVWRKAQVRSTAFRRHYLLEHPLIAGFQSRSRLERNRPGCSLARSETACRLLFGAFEYCASVSLAIAANRNGQPDWSGRSRLPSP